MNALAELIEAAERYQAYHDEKFYADADVKPTGLRPAIAKARAALSAARCAKCGGAGTVPCQGCDGKNFPACAGCHGSGVRACPACGMRSAGASRIDGLLLGVECLLVRCLRHGLLRAEVEAMLRDVAAARTLPSATGARDNTDILRAIVAGYMVWEALGDPSNMVKAINEAEVRVQEANATDRSADAA